MNMDYATALVQARQKQPLPFPAGSPLEQHAIQRFKQFFADFTPSKVHELLDETNAEQLFFNDTLKTLLDRDSLREYLRVSAEAVESCIVDVQDVVSNGAGDFYFRWLMTIRFKSFARGRDTQSIGISHIRFDSNGRVVLHQDFWNAADGLFQYVPVVGWLIRKIKQRL
jgi:hypothetical protein